MAESKSSITTLQRLLRMLKLDRSEISYIFLYAIFAGLINLSIPLGIQAILNFLQGGAVSSSWWILILIVTLGTLLAGMLTIMQLSVKETLQKKIFVRVSFDFAKRLQILRTENIRNEYMPELANRFFDTLTIQKGLPKTLVDISTAIMQVIFGLVLLSFYHPFFIFFGITLMTALLLIFRFSYSTGLKTSLIESKYKYEVAYWLEEIARAAFTFKISGGSDLPMKKTDGLVVKYLDAKANHFKVLSRQYGAIVGFKTLITFLLLALGGYLVIQNEINLGQFVAAELVILLILSSAEKLITSMDTFYDVLTALEKIGAIADMPIDIENGIDFSEVNNPKGIELSLQDINYRFEDRDKPVLKDINFDITAGERICLAGYNNSGKTTLIQLIACLLNLQKGTILYNQIPRYNFNQTLLRRHIGDFSSMDDIFKGNIRENISLGFPDCSTALVLATCKKVGLLSYVQSLPNGLDTVLLPQGKNLSRSIISKIILARCIISQPRLIAIEDFFVHLNQTDRENSIALLTDRSNPWTLIAISDDSDFASRCDQVIIMKDGEIVEKGDFESIRQGVHFKHVFK
jgi:ABC-type bacteriocin/lantibiotic exporter with double-glycine peptidase domain